MNWQLGLFHPNFSMERYQEILHRPCLKSINPINMSFFSFLILFRHEGLKTENAKLISKYWCKTFMNIETIELLSGWILSYFPAAKRRGNNNYFAASKDDCGCCSCRSAAKSSVICRTSSRQLQIRYDQQRDKLLLSLCKSFLHL